MSQLEPADYFAQMAGMAKELESLDFWSASQEEVQLADAATPGTDVALPSVVVTGLPTGLSVVRAVAMLKFRSVENTNAAGNKLTGAQYIQAKKGSGALTNAIAFVDDQFGLAAATREGGDVLVGNIDLATLVTGNDTYSFQWTAALVDQLNIQFNDVQTGLRIWFR